MSELRREPITGRWNIINTDVPMGPGDFHVEVEKPSGATCPFCPGNEQMTPPESYAVRGSGSAADGPGWKLRVVGNKFPALTSDGELDRRGLGVFDLSNGIGMHEVIIETPDHGKHMAEQSLQEIEQAFLAFKARSLDLRNDKRLKYALIFKNVGRAAGASLEHPHSQLIALPIVPKRVREELRGAERYFGFRERCPFCDMLQQERGEDRRIVCETSQFVAFCPFVSSFPFEVWILPKVHQSDFAAVSPEQVQDIAHVMKEVLVRMFQALGNPPYNFIIHTAPMEARERDDYHWHIELMPKLTKVAGFEWGTGFYINPTPPELAAQVLREISVSV